jgi:hypothetical protein
LDFRLTILDWVAQRRLCNISFHAKGARIEFIKAANSGIAAPGDIDLCETLCLGVFVAFLLL